MVHKIAQGWRTKMECITSNRIGWDDRLWSVSGVSVYIPYGTSGGAENRIEWHCLVVRMLCKVWLARQCCVDMHVYWHWSCGHARVLKMVKYVIIDWVIQCQMDNGHWNHPKMSSRQRGTYQISPKKITQHHRDFKIISLQIDEKK